MRREREEAFDQDQPTLVVTYGNTTRRYRPLDREVIVLGKAQGSDLQLIAPEVSPIHCLLVRGPDGGWQVRHFGGRIGTLVNGRLVQEAAVDHDDTLQIGSFSFRFHIPPRFRRPGIKPGKAADLVEMGHLRRSRRNLVRLALSLRERVHEAEAGRAQAERRVEQQEQDLDAMRESARSRQKALDAQRIKREAEERDHSLRCQALARGEAALAEHLKAAETEIAQKRAEADAAIRTAWEQFQQRRQAAEEGAAAEPAGSPTETGRHLERRATELAHYARHLRRAARQLAERETDLARRAQELEHEREELRRQFESAHTPSTLRDRLAKVQKMKKGLAMLRTSDSAPGVPLSRVEAQEAAVPT